MQYLKKQIQQDIQKAIFEDLHTNDGSGDITAQLIPVEQNSTATLINRENMILCGSQWFIAVFKAIDANIEIKFNFKDGDLIAANNVICNISGNTRSILSAERAALNFLQTLSATSTVTRKFIDALDNKNITILDTRKTIPGLRIAQKYAAKIGGAKNHRIGLYDAYLIKENHIIACGSITNAINMANKFNPNIPVEVEVESLDELKEALETNCAQILLDNFNLEKIQLAVNIRNSKPEYKNTKLEVSGNVDLHNINNYKNCGADYISIGSLTKNIQAIDLSLRLK